MSASMKPMNPKVKKLWIEALRSGKYKQGIKRLRTVKNRYCCLGVLCDLYAKEHGKRWSRDTMGEWVLGMERDYPPDSVIEWAGTKHIGKKIAGRDLAEHNDTGKTFLEIADLIEKHL